MKTEPNSQAQPPPEKATEKIRVRPSTRGALANLAQQRGQTYADLIDDMIAQETARPMMENFIEQVVSRQRAAPSSPILRYSNGFTLMLSAKGWPYFIDGDGFRIELITQASANE